MGLDSFGVVEFDLGTFIQGQTRLTKLESAYNFLLSVLEVCNVKSTYRKSWARNFMM